MAAGGRLRFSGDLGLCWKIVADYPFTGGSISKIRLTAELTLRRSDLTCRELTLPLAQLQNPSSAWQSQDDSAPTAPRKCLLKGCDRYFSPNHPLDRYCSGDCKEAARRWRIAKANLNYRASENGKLKRREQTARYRTKCKERQAQCGIQHRAAPQDPDPDRSAAPPKGYRKHDSQEKSCCHRPDERDKGTGVVYDGCLFQSEYYPRPLLPFPSRTEKI